MIVVALGRGVVVGGRHRDVPDVLPGHDRDDPRAALARSARARADALVRRVALGDLLEGPPAGVAAVPLHRAQDRGDGEHRRGHHRRGPGGIQDGLGRVIIDVQPVVHHRAGEAVGGDPRRGAARDRVLRLSSASSERWPAARPAEPLADTMTAVDAAPVVRLAGVDEDLRSAGRRADRSRSRTSTSRSAGASSSRSSGRPAAASRRCCASSAT